MVKTAEKLSHGIWVQLKILIEPMFAHVDHNFDNRQANYNHSVTD
jgi:hypothetical protein